MTAATPLAASAKNGAAAALSAVFLRHLRQWWPIPLVALLAAIVERLWRAPEPVAWTPLVLMAMMSMLPAVLDDFWTGAVTRFAMARPLPWWAWWGGRVAAALLLVTLGVGLLGVPALVTGASLEELAPTWLAEQLSVATSFGLAITFISAVRAGSVGSALVVAAAAVFFWSPLVVGWTAPSSEAASGGRLLVASLGVVTFAVASAAMVAGGRGDPRRAVGAAALVWGLAATPLAAWGGWRWAYPVPPPALTGLLRVEIARATDDGQWLHVGGFADPAGRGRADFLVHAQDGRWQRLPAVWNRLIALDSNGGRLAWIEYGGTGGLNPALVVAALDGRGGPVVERRHVLEYRQPRFDALVLRGNRVAIVAPEWVQVRDADSGAALATAVRSGPQRLAALTGDGALVFARDAVTGGFDVRDVEVVRLRAGRAEELLMTTRELARGDTLALSGDGRRWLVCRVDRRAPPVEPRLRATLYDVERGAELAAIDVPRVSLLSTGSLADGRMVVAGRAPNRRVLVAAFGEAVPPTVTEVGQDAGAVLLGGEVAPGVVSLGMTTSAADSTQTLFVDVTAARVVRTLPGVTPLVRFRFPLDEDAWRTRAPRQAFFLGPGGVVVLDGVGDPPRVVVESARAADWLAPAR